MATVSLSKAQKAAMRQLKGVPYAVIAAPIARALVGKGLAQYATIDPPPTLGLAISATTKGRSVGT